MLRKILVGFDGSDGALRAFDFASDVAEHYAASVVALAIIRLPEPSTSLEIEALLDASRLQFEKGFDVPRARARSRGIALETLIEVGHPAEHIVAYAEKEACDLIVMGRRGKTTIARWMLGSVSERVLRYAHCPVTVVK